MDLQWIDIFVLAVIGISAILGLFRGLMREVIALAGWLVAGWVAFKFAGPLGEQFADAISLPSVRMALAFLGLMVVTLFVFGVLGYLVGKAIDSTGLTGTDRMLGVAFGVVRGIAILTLLVILAGLTPLPRDPWWRQSQFIGRLEQ
ncbi:MAG: CvpA family protein, partial [Gammaproteobacteria bacterium]